MKIVMVTQRVVMMGGTRTSIFLMGEEGPESVVIGGRNHVMGTLSHDQCREALARGTWMFSRFEHKRASSVVPEDVLVRFFDDNVGDADVEIENGAVLLHLGEGEGKVDFIGRDDFDTMGYRGTTAATVLTDSMKVNYVSRLVAEYVYGSDSTTLRV